MLWRYRNQMREAFCVADATGVKQLGVMSDALAS